MPNARASAVGLLALGKEGTETMIRNQRSDGAKAWRKLYYKKEWRQARERQLFAKPLCERCEARGIIVAATVVNHKTPHKGDVHLFFDPDNHESVCKPCHDADIQSEECIGFSDRIGVDGFPSDERHPFNRASTQAGRG